MITNATVTLVPKEYEHRMAFVVTNQELKLMNLEFDTTFNQLCYFDDPQVAVVQSFAIDGAAFEHLPVELLLERGVAVGVVGNGDVLIRMTITD